MNELLIVSLTILATHRVTHFVVADRIVQHIRERIQWYFENRWVHKNKDTVSMRERIVAESDEWQSLGAYFLSCSWCTSFYIGGITTTVIAFTVGLPAPVLVWLAASTVTGLLSNKE